LGQNWLYHRQINIEVAMSKYIVRSTEPVLMPDAKRGAINGVLITIYLPDYDEVHEIRIPEMNAKLAQTAIEQFVKQRDTLASLGETTK